MEDYYKIGEFEYNHLTEFISMIEHRYKSFNYVYDKFIDWVNNHDNESLDKAHILYLCGYITYLANMNNKEVPKWIHKYDNEKLDKLLFNEGLVYLESKLHSNLLLKTYDNRILEFAKYNIIVDEINLAV